jgi:ABC-type antimicrobial peptide transport system permease subunit
MALGASAGSRQAEILAQVFGLLAAGAVIGGAASLGLAPAFQMLLVGVSGFDPVSVRGRGPLLAIVGLAAGIVPAIRASRVLPMRALRRAAGSL